MRILKEKKALLGEKKEVEKSTSQVTNFSKFLAGPFVFEKTLNLMFETFVSSRIFFMIGEQILLTGWFLFYLLS